MLVIPETNRNQTHDIVSSSVLNLHELLIAEYKYLGDCVVELRRGLTHIEEGTCSSQWRVHYSLGERCLINAERYFGLLELSEKRLLAPIFKEIPDIFYATHSCELCGDKSSEILLDALARIAKQIDSVIEFCSPHIKGK